MLDELDPTQVADVLRSEQTGRLSCDVSGRTYVVPVRYQAGEPSEIYLQQPDEPCLRLAGAAPRVQFEVDSVRGPGSWRTVVGWGTVERLDGGPPGDRATRDETTARYRIRFTALRGFFRGSA